VSGAVKKHSSDRYTKKFTTSDHLVSMLFSTFAHCSSLREVAGGMLGLKGKINHFQLKNVPYRSTLSDANIFQTSPLQRANGTIHMFWTGDYQNRGIVLCL